MLHDLLLGLEKSRFILITDEATCSGRHLLLNCLRNLVNRCDRVILVCFERHPDYFMNQLSANINKKVSAVCGRTVSENLAGGEDVLDAAVSLAAAHDDVELGVVVDSLSLSILFGLASTTCRTLHSLTKDKRVVQVMSLLHRDVHEQNTVSLIEHVASTVIRLVEQAGCGGDKLTCALRHCRNTGKVFTTLEQFSIDGKNFSVQDVGSVSQNSSAKRTSQSDPTTDLSFSLSLTESEKTARSKVPLPYLKNDEGFRSKAQDQPSSKILYLPDQGDDFDDDDPDDDLNI